MQKESSIKEWQSQFRLGLFNSPDKKTQILAGWYDWFCKDSSLRNKTYKMGNIVKQVKEGGKVNLKNWYVWFKNNCPMVGPLYDDFRFARLDNGDVQMTIQINCPFKDTPHKYTVWGRRYENTGFKHDAPLFECDDARQLVKWLNTPWDD